MMQNMFPWRRAMLLALAGVALVSTCRLSFGQADKSEPAKADDDAGKGAAKKRKPTVLTVVVTGNDKPIAKAEVKVWFPPNAGGEATHPSDEAGEATFNSATTGTAKVRVIVPGWQSVLQDVVLKEGPQRLTIKLTPLP